MTADLVLLSLSFAFMAAGLSHLAIAIKRMACAAFSEALNSMAQEIR